MGYLPPIYRYSVVFVWATGDHGEIAKFTNQRQADVFCGAEHNNLKPGESLELYDSKGVKLTIWARTRK